MRFLAHLVQLYKLNASLLFAVKLSSFVKTDLQIFLLCQCCPFLKLLLQPVPLGVWLHCLFWGYFFLFALLPAHCWLQININLKFRIGKIIIWSRAESLSLLTYKETNRLFYGSFIWETNKNKYYKSCILICMSLSEISIQSPSKTLYLAGKLLLARTAVKCFLFSVSRLAHISLMCFRSWKRSSNSVLLLNSLTYFSH